MLEKYKGKKVKIIASSNSGAGTGVACTGSLTSVISNVITIFGEISSFDEKFIELTSARTVSFDGFQTGYSSVMGSKDIVPSVLDNSVVLVNLDSVITISIVG